MLHIVCVMEDVTTIFSESHNDEAPITLTSCDSMTDVDPPLGCAVAGVLIALGALGGVVALLIGGAP